MTKRDISMGPKLASWDTELLREQAEGVIH